MPTFEIDTEEAERAEDELGVEAFDEDGVILSMPSAHPEPNGQSD